MPRSDGSWIPDERVNSRDLLPRRAIDQRDRQPVVNETHQELRAVLRAAGAPPVPDLAALERAVRVRVTADARTSRTGWWQSWSMAGLVAAGLACGLLSAAWRVERPADQVSDAHVRYLQLIDPLARSSGALES